jgi:hypothetical protein
METFNIDKEYTVACEWKKTRTGFKHEATLLRNGSEIDKTKVNYYNRTWESYEYETVIKKLLSKHFKDEQLDNYLKDIRTKQHEAVNQEFRMTAQVAKLGELFGKDKKESNDWKKRMLKAGLEGLDFPDDWDGLSEEEKEIRLNNIIGLCSKVNVGDKNG